MTDDPLPSAIRDALLLMDGDDRPDDARLTALAARLALARAAADTEIHELAVEGLQETLEDAAAQIDEANRAGLLHMLRTSLEAYALQLAHERGRA